MTTFTPITNSTFLDFAGYDIVNPSQTASDAYNISDPTAFPNNATSGINVAIVLDRANDPTTMLAGDWASRQSMIDSLNATNSLWTTYGTALATYNAAQDFLKNTLGLTILDSSNSNYVSTPESRTIWVEINTQTEWQALFGPDSTLLYYQNSEGGDKLWYWENGLSAPSELAIAGLWIDQETRPGADNMAGSATTTLVTGPQSAGNSGPSPNTAPQSVATSYNFPLDGSAYQTGMIGLIEPATGSYVSGTDPGGSTFQSLLTQYLDKVGTQGTGGVFVQGANGQTEASGERSLDVGVASAVNPNSNLALYNGSGRGADANVNSQSTVFTAFQAAIWAAASNYAGTETVGPAPVVSSSDTDVQGLSPLSPFYQAYMQLFVDAALMNQTVLVANGDGGSGGKISNGLANVVNSVTSPYNILVGGTSLSTVGQASQDPTLNGTDANFTPIYLQAMAGDLGTIWSLVAGGLSYMPGTAAASDWFIETAWNDYRTTDDNQFEENHSYGDNNSSAGGIDMSQGTPDYQIAYGLTSSAYSNLNLTGRALPDVSANAGGNLFYLVPQADMSGTAGVAGTSAATPLWAGLITQINYILHDQGLNNNLGYMTDLLYMAAVIAPASFNDVQVGNNTSTFNYRGGTDYGGMNPTGSGYEAQAGYDLVTGLGSPDGMFLARAISTIAHSQMFYSADVPGVSTLVPDVIDSNGAGGWTSGTAQTLLVQTTATGAATVSVQTGADSTDASSAAHAAYAWTSQLAQQSLQSNTDFDPDLLALFDGQTQGTLTQAVVADGASVSVSFNGNTTVAAQAGMSASFGFADFYSDPGNSVRLAQSVAVAETANHADGVNVVVRMRQVAGADLSLVLYEVDDYNGTISVGGVSYAPGDAGYAAAVASVAYNVQGGGSVIAGPGNGNYSQVEITGVDAGDLIAMQLTNITNGDTFWAFSQANEVVNGEHVSHLWNYGANTWGWEDLYGGGDRDFNDLVVQLDFTSTAGSGLLVA